MFKREFIDLADAIKKSPVKFSDKHISVLADFCQDQNRFFKRDRWLEYIAGECGPNGGPVKKPVEHQPNLFGEMEYTRKN